MADDIEDQVRDFFKVLEQQLNTKPTADGMADVFGEYVHLSKAIENAADMNPEYAGMLERGFAIRAREPWISSPKMKGWMHRKR